MIYFVFVVAGRRKGGSTGRLPTIRLEPEHAVEIVGLVPPLLYFVVILAEAAASGGSTRWCCSRCTSRTSGCCCATRRKQEEKLADAPRVSQWAYRQPGWRRPAAISGLFVVGGVLLYLTAHPFLESMLAVAGDLRRQPVRPRAVGRAVPLGVPRVRVDLLLGAPGAPGAHGAHEHGVEQHQPVDRARRDDPAGVRLLAPAPPRQLDRLPLRRRSGSRSC